MFVNHNLDPQPRETDTHDSPRSRCPPSPEPTAIDIAQIYIPERVKTTFERLTQRQLPALHLSNVRCFDALPMDLAKARRYTSRSDHSTAPPIDVYRSYGGMHIVANGRHRLAAALCNRRTHIHALLHPGVHAPPYTTTNRWTRSEPDEDPGCTDDPVVPPPATARPKTAYGGRRIGEASHPGPAEYCDCKYGEECKHPEHHAHKAPGKPLTGAARREQEAAVRAKANTRGGGKPTYVPCKHGAECLFLACHAHAVNASPKAASRGAAREALLNEALQNDEEWAAGEQDAHSDIAREREAALKESSPTSRENKETEEEKIVPSATRVAVAAARATSSAPRARTYNNDLFDNLFSPTLEAQMAALPATTQFTFGNLTDDQPTPAATISPADRILDTVTEEDEAPATEEKHNVGLDPEWRAINEARLQSAREAITYRKQQLDTWAVARGEAHERTMTKIREYAERRAERKKQAVLNREHTERGIAYAKQLLADEKLLDPLAKSTVIVYRTGDALTNSRLWDSLCRAIVAVVPFFNLADEHTLNQPATHRVSETCKVTNSTRKRLRIGRWKLGKKRKPLVTSVATLPRLYNLCSEVEIFDKLYTLLMANPQLSSRRALDGNGTLLPSLQAAAWHVVTHAEGFTEWVKEPLIMQWTVMHFVNQRHHLGIVGASGMTDESFPQLFRNQGLLSRS